MERPITEIFDSVLRATCSYYRVKHKAVMNIGRLGKSPTEEARMVVCYLLWERKYSFAEIGRTMGYKNHTGALKNVKAITGVLSVGKGKGAELRISIATINKKIDDLYPAMQGRQLTILD